MFQLNGLRVTAVVCGLLWGASWGYAEGWQAGSARAMITPQEPIWMAGYGGRDRPAEGTLTELWAKALVIQDAQDQPALLITLDLVGIHRSTAAAICQRIAKTHEMTRDQIAINCSHTHTGPAVGSNLGPLHYERVPAAQQAELDQYEAWLIERVVGVADEAIAALEPAALTWGSGLCTVAVNRRNNVEANVPTLRREGTLRGPFDHAVPVLMVRDAKGELMTVVFGYACHATVLSFYQWSGDYPGFAQLALEQRYPEATAMFWAGCGADQNPLPRREVALAEGYGQRLAAAVAEVVEGTPRPLEPTLQTDYREIELPLENLPTVPSLRQILDNNDQANRYAWARASYLLDEQADHDWIDAEGKLATSYPYPIQTWQLGEEVRMVFLGGEVVIDYALAIKSFAETLPDQRREQIWVAGYSNDVMAYIPSRRVLNEGGYEAEGSNVYYGLPGRWSPELERQIIREVRAQAGAEN